MSVRGDRQFGRVAERGEIPLRICVAGQRPQREAEQLAATLCGDGEDGEHAVRQRLALAEMACVERIAVVADEQQRRGDGLLLPRHLQAQPVVAQALEHGEGGGECRQPLRRVMAVALLDQLRIGADRGVVDEGMAVDPGEVDTAQRSCSDKLCRVAQVQRHAERTGEVVARAERQDAERRPALHQRACRRAERAIAAADDHQLPVGQRRRRVGNVAASHHADIDRQSGGGKRGLDRARAPIAQPARGAAAGVDQDGNVQIGASSEAGGCENHWGPAAVMWKQSSSRTPNLPGR